jgi:hypothetical protein
MLILLDMPRFSIAKHKETLSPCFKSDSENSFLEKDFSCDCADICVKWYYKAGVHGWHGQNIVCDTVWRKSGKRVVNR